MKKLLSILLVLLLVTGSACAETSTYWMYKYNALAKIYGAPVLSEDMITKDNGEEIDFHCGDMFISFNNDHADILAPDSADFLPACVCIAFTFSKESTGAVSFLGNLLYSYMMVKSGKTADPLLFNSLVYFVSSTDQGLLFFIGGS